MNEATGTSWITFNFFEHFTMATKPIALDQCHRLTHGWWWWSTVVCTLLEDTMCLVVWLAPSATMIIIFKHYDFSAFGLVSLFRALSSVHHTWCARRAYKTVDMVHCLHWTSFPSNVYFLLCVFVWVKCRRLSLFLSIRLFCGTFHCVRSHRMVQFDGFDFWSPLCTLRVLTVKCMESTDGRPGRYRHV